jgi:hypothetical protein
VPAVDLDLAGDQGGAAAIAVLDDFEHVMALLGPEVARWLDVISSMPVAPGQAVAIFGAFCLRKLSLRSWRRWAL